MSTIIPRGIRNCNPLNIRYVGRNKWQGRIPSKDKKDRMFEEFVSNDYGFRAAFILIHKYITAHKCNTVRKLISRWAPARENNTEYYIRTVCYRACMPEDTELDFCNGHQMFNLVSEMQFMECGKDLSLHDMARGYVMACESLNVQPHWSLDDLQSRAYYIEKRLYEKQKWEENENL